ncbi:MAG TPA: hypothetical protein VGM89_01510 [Puia sp.]|jgi:hypothetical protein
MRIRTFNGLGLLLVMLVMSTRLSAQEYGGNVRYSGWSTVGVITVVSDGFGKNIKESNSDALAGAFYTLLFRGLPGSAYELPMVPHEEEKKNDPTVVALLKGGYGSFVMDDRLQGRSKTTKKADGVSGIATTHLVTINCAALRRYLEEKVVIRKFGN